MPFEYLEEGRGRHLRGDCSKFVKEVTDALKNTDIRMEEIFGDDRWDRVENMMPRKTFNEICDSIFETRDHSEDEDEGPVDVVFILTSEGSDCHNSREFMIALMDAFGPTIKAYLRNPCLR
jgi:hypothetical protein